MTDFLEKLCSVAIIYFLLIFIFLNYRYVVFYHFANCNLKNCPHLFERKSVSKYLEIDFDSEGT